MSKETGRVMVVRRLSVVLALAALLGLPEATTAQPRVRYERALAHQNTLRLDGPRPSPLSQMRRAVATYEAIVRRYPASGYADNALLQAATVARAAYRVYGSDVDREQAVKFLEWLVREYSSSSLRPRARKLLRDVSPTRAARSTPSSSRARSARAGAASTRAAALTPAAASSTTASPGSAATVAASASRGTGMASLRDVRRELVAGIVRVTLVFDAEVAYQHDELAGPPRLFFDLPRTAAVPALHDAVLAFDGPALRHIRLGRPRSETTRVVMDLHGVRSYTVFALYNPYRLIVDLVPTEPHALSARAVAPPAPHEPSVVPASIPDPSAAAVEPTEPPRLSPRPLPHPLADRPVAAPIAASTRAVATTRVRPLSARALGVRSLPAYGAVAARPIANEVATWLAAERARRAPAPLAMRTTTPSALPAPAAPVPNNLGGFSLARQLGLSVSRIVIDPGHGGHDPGTLGHKTTEAEVVLDVALRLEKLLMNEPGFEVVLTRRSDVFIPLEDRPAVANRMGADLFLSIHANASRNKQASGVETYFLNFASNPEAEAVAARENATAGRSMHHLPDMVKAIALNNKLDESRDFARKVQDSLIGGLRNQSRDVRDRGVKQAPFVVLIGAGMPSVLAEIAFISNAEEGGLLRSGAYRQRIAQALFEAIRKYQRSLKTVGTVASQ